MNFSRMRWTGVLAVVLMLSLGGCRSRQDTAIEQAKKQAATTGQQQELLLRPIGKTVYFMPPYILDDAEIALLGQRTLSVFEQVIA